MDKNATRPQRPLCAITSLFGLPRVFNGQGVVRAGHTRVMVDDTWVEAGTLDLEEGRELTSGGPGGYLLLPYKDALPHQCGLGSPAHMSPCRVSNLCARHLSGWERVVGPPEALHFKRKQSSRSSQNSSEQRLDKQQRHSGYS